MRAAGRIAIVAAAFTALLYTHSGCGPAVHPRHGLFGTVRDARSGQPLPAAEVLFMVRGSNAPPYSAWTRRDGTFLLQGIPVGSTGTVICRKAGFRESTTDFTIQFDQEQLDLELTPSE